MEKITDGYPPPEYVGKIRALRSRLGLTQAGLAQKCDVPQQSVSGWESGRSEPSARAYSSLARLAGEPGCWWFWNQIGLTRKDLVSVSASPAWSPPQRVEVGTARGGLLKSRADVFAVPLLSDAAAAGEPRTIDASQVERNIFLDASNPMFHHADRTVCLRIVGRSMYPILDDGFVVGVDTGNTNPVTLAGRMVAARDPEGGVTIKWLRRTPDGLLLMPQYVSPRFNPVLLNPEWSIVGEVVWWIGKPAK